MNSTLRDILIVLVPLAAVATGVAILWVQSRLQIYGRAAAPRWRAKAMSAVGWTVLLLGIFAAVTPFFAVVGWIITAVILISLYYRYQAIERRSLLWALMMAAERGIPLETAARAFAEERHDAIGSRALDLAEYLEAGLPLAPALRRSRLPFPPAVLLTAELGQQTNDLGGALRQMLAQSDESDAVLRSAAEKLFYLGFLVLFSFMLNGFLVLKIVPVYQKIFDDFGATLPLYTRWFITFTHVFVNYWMFVLPALLLLLIVLVRSLSFYTGSSARWLPGLTPLWQQADRAIVLRWLAVAVRQNRSLADMMRLLSGYVAGKRLRHRLERAVKRIDQGSDWTDSLQRAGLIAKAEAALFRSAQRAGNLDWALEEMGHSAARRLTYRLRKVINVAVPAAVLAFGLTVLFAATAMLVPLLSLIQNLT
ncbi:MAG: hypothetical protein GXY83_16805 [Rhodopirellula sp.]|nr:hypothetical protein [Rhodopirellula sp.]